MDVLICKEPFLVQEAAPKFRDTIIFTAQREVELEGVTFTLYSQATTVEEEYWKSSTNLDSLLLNIILEASSLLYNLHKFGV